MVEEDNISERIPHFGDDISSSQSFHGETSLTESELEYIPNPQHQGNSHYIPRNTQRTDSPSHRASIVTDKIIINVGRTGLGCR